MIKKVSRLFAVLLCGFMFFGCSMIGGSEKSGTTTTQDITVSFDTNGGNEIEPMFIKQGTDIADIEWPTPVREGYTFVDWVDQYGSGPNCGVGHSDKHWDYFSFLVDYGTSEVTLYAKWKSENPSIVFDANGGKFVFEDGSEKEKVSFPYKDLQESYDETTIDQFIQTKKDTLNPLAKKEHYNFSSWDYSSGYDCFYKLQNGEDYVIKVNWNPANEITFNTNGGSELPVYEFNSFVDANTLYSDDSLIVTKLDYVFAGWYLDAELTNPFTSSIYESKTLFAKWVKKDYEVTQATLSSTLENLSKAMSYKSSLYFTNEADITETRINSETFNLKYTGIMSEDDVATLKDALDEYSYKEILYVNLNLSEATGLTSIPSGAFQNCKGLRKIQISEKISYIQDHAFYGCGNLKTVVLPAKLLTIDINAFCECTVLSSITIPQAVVSLGSSAFEKCSALTAITLPESLTSVGSRCFSGTGLKEIELPEGITTVSDRLFSSCKNLSKVTLSNNVVRIDNSAFSDCTALASISIPSGVSIVGSGAFENCTSLQGIDLQANTSLTEIKSDTFKGCTSMKSFKIHDNLETIGDSAFEDCKVLENQNYLNKAYLTKIGKKAFQNCIAITEMKLPNSIQTIDESAFNACVALKTINIPQSLTAIASHTFDGCGELKTVTFGGISGLKSVGERAFVDCSKLNGFTIPATVTTIAPNAFLNCIALTSITIPAAVEKIYAGVFENCVNLNSVTFAETTGWKISNRDDGTGTAITESLTDDAENAGLLKTKYVSKIWTRITE